MVRILKEKLEDYGKENPPDAEGGLPEPDDDYGLRRAFGSDCDPADLGLQEPPEGSGDVLLEERYETVMRNLLTEIEITRVKGRSGTVKENVDKNQKDYILRSS